MADEATEESSGETPVSLDLATASEDELLAAHTSLGQQIEALKEEPATLDIAEQVRALQATRNEIARAINALRATLEETDEEVTLDAPAAETAPEGTVIEQAEVTEEAPASEVAEDAEVEAPAEAEASAEVEAPAEAEAPAEVTEVVAEEEAPAIEAEADTLITDNDDTTDNNKETTVSDNTPSPADADPVGEAEKILAETNEPVLASAEERPLGETDEAPVRPTVRWQAGGGQTEYNQGTELNYEQIGRVMEASRSARQNVSAPRSAVVASLPEFAQSPELQDRVITSRMGAAEATRKIADAVEAWQAERDGHGNAVTAAVCTPLDIIREIPQCGSTDTPFADMFPQVPITRLGFQFFPAMSASETDSGIAAPWEGQDSVAEATPGTWKPTVQITCADATPAVAEEITASAQVDTSTEMSQPEHVEEFMHKLAVQRARRREQWLLGEFDNLAASYTFGGYYGSFSSLLFVICELLPQLTYGERLDNEDYDLVLEPGHIEKLVQDESARIYGDSAATRRASIEARIKEETGVRNIVYLKDFKSGSFTAVNQPAYNPTPLPNLPDVQRVRVVPAGSFLYGATGEESTGWETDPQLARQNKSQWFSSEWSLLAKHGCAPAATVDVTSFADGTRGGSRDIEPGAHPYIDLSAS